MSASDASINYNQRCLLAAPRLVAPMPLPVLMLEVALPRTGFSSGKVGAVEAVSEPSAFTVEVDVVRPLERGFLRGPRWVSLNSAGR